MEFSPDHELSGVLARLIAEVTAALVRTAAPQQRLASALRTAYPGDVDDLHAAALTGAPLGAIDAAVHSAAGSGRAARPEVVHRAARIALCAHLSTDDGQHATAASSNA